MKKVLLVLVFLCFSLYANDWKYSNDIDLFTDSKKHFFTMYPIETVAGSIDISSFYSVSIIIRKSSELLEIFIPTDSYIAKYSTKLKVRFDKGEAKTYEVSMSTDGKAMFIYQSDIEEFLYKLLSSDELLIAYTPYNDYEVTVRFSIKGLQSLANLNNVSFDISDEVVESSKTYTFEDINKTKEEQKEECKNNPESCGIEIQKIDSDLIYTQDDLDNAKTIAKSEAKDSCQKDPESCGITIVSECNNDSSIKATSSSSSETPPSVPTVQTHVLVKEQIDNLSVGWHLLGTGSIINDMSIFDNANSVWSYNSGKWEQNPTEIQELQGFWVKK